MGVSSVAEWLKASEGDTRWVVGVPSLEGTLNVRTKFCHCMELRDRAVGSGSAQQAMLSAGSDLVNPPIHPFDQISLKNVPPSRCNVPPSMGNELLSGHNVPHSRIAPCAAPCIFPVPLFCKWLLPCLRYPAALERMPR